MNNPESGSQFLSPLRTQPLKKQRGGATPDVAHRSTMSRQPLTAASGASANESAQEAIARRRAELRRLQGLREARADAKRPEVTSVSASASASASHALTSSAAAGPAPPFIPGPPQGPSRGPPKPPGGGVARHHSDIFPAVHKSPARERKAVPDLAKPSVPLPSLPVMTMSMTAGSTAQRPVPPQGPPPTRTSSSSRSSRAKSAPPVRPPPPPSPVAGSSAVNATATAPHPPSPSGAPTSLRGPPKVLASTTVRPFPISPGSFSLEPNRREDEPAVIMETSLTTPLLSPPKWIEQDGKIIPLSPVPPKPLPPPHQKLPPMAPSLPTMDRTPRDKGVGLAPRATTNATAATPRTTTKSTTATALEEEEEDAKTPIPVHTPMVPPMSASRRERIAQMRAGLVVSSTTATTTTTRTVAPETYNDSTSSPPSSPSTKPPLSSTSSATAALLEQTLKETMEDKKMALQQIKLLEEELLKARQKELQALQPTTTGTLLTQQPKPLQKMLQLADSDGEAAAWKWAKLQVAGVPPLSSVESPLRPGHGSMSSSSAAAGGGGGPALLRPPPQPKLFAMQKPPHSEDSQPPPAPPSMVMMERQWIQFFREAVECVTLEYESDLATFFVRRPYGMEPIPSPLFAQVVDGSLVDDCAMYSKKAHVSTVSTLQVAGVVKANGSSFLLYGVCDLKYQANPNDGEAGDDGGNDDDDDEEWSYLSLDRPSATSSMVVTFIDNEGVERDWSPQLVLEEALNVRDQYCRAITSTALGFKDRPPAPAAVPASLSRAEEKPKTLEIAVDTSDIPTDHVPPPASKATPPAVQKEGKDSPQQQEEEAGSGDVLAVFLGMVFRSIWNLVYWLLIGLPLAILRGSIVCAFVIAILSTVYLHLVETHHNGQALSTMWGATTGGYHSNAAVGIL